MAQSVCLVVPCYNESQRLPEGELLSWLAGGPLRHLILVDDGSRDLTLQVLRRIASSNDRVTVIVQPFNQGKAEAVRQGMLKACHQGHPLVGYWDADLATPLSEVDRFLQVLAQQPDTSIVTGCRLQRLGARVARRAVRHYSGRLVASLISLILRLPTYDTQCGAKMFRAQLVPELFGEPFVSRWLFDVEILARARNHLGMAGVLRQAMELPLQEWQDKGGSKLQPGDLLRVLPELWMIHRRYAFSERSGR